MTLSRARRSLSLIGLFCFASLTATAQEPQAKKSSVPLTKDQLSIYETFLHNWQEGSKSPLNVANTTDSFIPEADELQGCMKDFPRKSRAIETHQFPDDLANEQIRLLNPAEYKVPAMSDLMNQKRNLDDTVETMVNAGLMSLSEIIFSQDHRLAALQYSFQCGSRCGTGGTLIYEKRSGLWKKSRRRCSFWQS
jgi:hypothetical protein